jgi:endonuclease/exonuclease/phosphatase family metal-dependent hydrolase
VTPPPWWPPDPEQVRVVTFNAAAGNPRITTRQSDFVALPFYREALEGGPTAPLLALQEVGAEQARALRRQAQRSASRVLHVRRPGLGNALVVPPRYQLVSRRRRYYLAGQLVGAGAGLRAWGTTRVTPDWRQFLELRGWIEARLRDNASRRELTVITTHLSAQPALKLAQARTLAGRADRAAGRGPVVVAGDLNARTTSARDAPVWEALAGLRDMGTSEPSGRPDIDFVLAAGFEPVSARTWTGESLALPGSPDAESVSDHYAEDDILRYAA